VWLGDYPEPPPRPVLPGLTSCQLFGPLVTFCRVSGDPAELGTTTTTVRFHVTATGCVPEFEMRAKWQVEC